MLNTFYLLSTFGLVHPHSESDAIKVSRLHKHNAWGFLGTKFLIECKFHGRPPITVTWTKRGLDKLPSRAEYYGASLLIRNVITSDAGQYFCNASNEFGSRVTYINLSVYGRCRT